MQRYTLCSSYRIPLFYCALYVTTVRQTYPVFMEFITCLKLFFVSKPTLIKLWPKSPVKGC